MPTFPDKAQRPAKDSGVCPMCKGQKCVKQAGKTITCPTCRGSGSAGRGYITK